MILNMILKVNRDGLTTELPMETQRGDDTPKLQILEDEHVSFLLISPIELTAPVLWIQDVALPMAKERKNQEGAFEYSWHPSGDRPLFINHFGYSELAVELSGGEIYYAYVDVLARKINADNAQNILRYLESQITGITNYCFSLTHQKGGSNSIGSSSPQQIIQEIRLGVQSFIELIPQFNLRRRSRLTSAPKLVAWDEANNFTERCIDYVLTHPDTLSPSMNTTRSIQLGNRYYVTQAIETDMISESTDVYENRVIVAYLETCATSIGKIEKHFSDFIATLGKQEETISIPINYQSIFAIRRHFGTRYGEKILGECKDIQRQIAYCLEFVRKKLSVSRPVYGMPQATPGFLSTNHYRKIFERIVAFYRMGEANIAGSQFLYNLRTLDKLYEFFCLYRLIEAFEKVGFILKQTELLQVDNLSPIFSNVQPASSYTFGRNSLLRVSLYYDREITSLPRKVLVKQRWKRDRRPDFLIELYDGSNYTYFILDAKYTTPERAREVYLPDLTMKYYHGLGIAGLSRPPCLGVFALHPYQNGKTPTFFHKDAFNLSSDSPAIPALGTLAIDPDGDASPLSDLLLRFIDVFKSQFSK